MFLKHPQAHSHNDKRTKKHSETEAVKIDFRTIRHAIFSNRKARRWYFVGVIILLCGACIGIPKYLKDINRRQRQEVLDLMSDLMVLEYAKQEAAMEHQLTNGYAIKCQDVSGYLGGDPESVKLLSRCVNEEGHDGKLVYPTNTPYVYIFNVVGVPAKIRCLRNYAGFRAGTEISASIGDIFFTLDEIERAKQQMARAEHWKNGYPVSWDDIPGINRDKFQDCVLFTLNPIGIPATARLQKPWKDLRAGFEIASDYPNPPSHQ